MHIRTPRHSLFSLPDILANADGDAGGGTAPQATPAAPTNPATSGDKGYPEGTPLEQMTAPQQAAYWKAYARKHEDRAKAYGDLNPDEVAALREKAARADALDLELGTEAEKAAASARAEATAAAVPAIVRAEFKAAAKGVLSAEQLSALLEDRDLSKYADSKGNPNEDKIAALVAQFAPAAPARPAGPSATGLGNRATPPAAPGDQGRAMAAKRFGTKTS